MDPSLESGLVVPLQEFIVKTYERCNLACDYCYMYEMADQTWKDRPTKMTTETFARVSERIAEHVKAHSLAEIYVVLHGGEPVLAGEDFYRFAIDNLQKQLPTQTAVHYRLQTNGTLLTDAFLTMCSELNIHVGVSLDGSKEGNDRHRLYRNGQSSYDKVITGLQLLATDYRHIFSRVYATVDVDNDPIATYESLARFTPPLIDFLLPHGNWDEPPPKRNAESDETPYGDWMSLIFDHWYGATEPQPPVRFFTEILNMLLGGNSGVESIGLSPAALVAIDTDGAIEQVDSLKSAFNGATHTGFDVFNNTFDEVLQHPGVQFRQLGIKALSQTCLACPIHLVCGAGYLPHRYSAKNKFDNPSVYCKDLTRLIGHISDRLTADLVAM